MFIVNNLQNVSDVSVVFYTFKDVPVFLSIVFGFVLGALTVMPICLFSKHKKASVKKEKQPKKEDLKDENAPLRDE